MRAIIWSSGVASLQEIKAGTDDHQRRQKMEELAMSYVDIAGVQARGRTIKY